MPVSKFDTVEQIEAKATREGGCLVRSDPRYARHTNILRHGPMPEGLCVCHTCDNPKCILDAHHWRGTKAQNTQDAVAKGRHSGFRKGGQRFHGQHTPEALARIHAAVIERWQDPAFKAKMSAINKAAWERRRAAK